MSQPSRMIEGRNDFLPLYAGASLLDSGALYDNAQLLAAESELAGFSSETHGYMRPPFVAALMRPLTQLPYRPAWRVWQVASLAALAAFVFLWDPKRRMRTALIAALSIPALLVWLKGQDVFFLLLAVAVSVRLRESDRPLAAGAVFALCAAKAHLFLLTPVWVIALRDWSFLKGLLYGGLALAGVSTAVAGWQWPLEMWREMQTPAFSPGLSDMPNLHGTLNSLTEIAVSIGVAWAVWTIARRTSFRPALAAGILGGVLLARHSYVLDLALLIPAMITLLESTNRLMLQAAAILLLAPPLLFLAIQGAPYSTAVTLLCTAVLVGWALDSQLEGAPA